MLEAELARAVASHGQARLRDLGQFNPDLAGKL